jgi:hypothetical protein
MPKSIDLPKPLEKLARRQAVEITHRNFHQDVNRLIRDLRELQPQLRKARAESPPSLSREAYERKELVYFDRESNLQWTVRDNGQDITWHGAREYSERLSLAGYYDWRLPTVDELKGLYEVDEEGRFRIKPQFRLSGHFLWSSIREGPNLAFDVHNAGENLVNCSHSYNHRVLCVRDSGK